MSETIHRRSLPDSLRYLADKLDSGTLSEAEQAGVALSLRMLADEITPPTRDEAGPDGDPDTICGASHRADPDSTSPRLVVRCTRGWGHTGVHAGHDFDGRGPYQWPTEETAT